MTTPAATAPEISADCIIVGGGFSGCYALHWLREQGYTAKLIDAGADFGGTWHFNKYPGARVDSEVPLYQLTPRKAWQGFTFTNKFPDQREMQAYFTRVGNVLDLRRDAVFQHYIVDCTYDDAASLWRLKSDKGLQATGRYVFFATGTTNKVYVPDFPGLDNYKGQIAHTRYWPDDVFLGEKKKIALIGQGSTGTQLLQEIAKLDAEVTVFVRTPAVAYPLRQKSMSMADYEKVMYDFHTNIPQAKQNLTAALSLNIPTTNYHTDTPEQRRAVWEQAFKNGSFGLLGSTYRETMMDDEASAGFYQFWREKACERIKDPAKRKILAPEEQPIHFMAKRPVFESDYFEMMDRDNVKIVDLKQCRLKEFTENGIVTAGGKEGEEKEMLREFDLVILATGYDSVTGSLKDMNIRDKNGILLQDKWKDGISTHMGLMVPGMPNAFMIYGPQAPGPLSNSPTFSELQVEMCTELMSKAEADGRERIEPTEEAAARWKEKLYQGFNVMNVSRGNSWWVGSNIPGKKREPLIWFGGVPAYREGCETSMKSWDDFEPEKAQETAT